MSAFSAASIVLADWVSSAQNFVQVFTLVYFLLIFAYILMSWCDSLFALAESDPAVPLRRHEPYLRIFRRILPPSVRSTCRRWLRFSRLDREPGRRQPPGAAGLRRK